MLVDYSSIRCCRSEGRCGVRGCDCSQGQDVFMVLSGEAEGRQSCKLPSCMLKVCLQSVGDIWAPEIWEISANI